MAMEASDLPDFDDDDWIDLEKTPAPGAVRPLATVKLTKMAKPGARVSAARSTIWLRRELADWAREKGPRFRVQIGGAGANLLRVIPDLDRGKYETADFHGSLRINLGIVNVWPDEDRAPAEAAASITPGGLVLRLPEGFARPTLPMLPSPSASPPAAARVEKPASPIDLPSLPSKAITAREIAVESEAMKVALGVTGAFPHDIGGQHFTPTEAAMIESLLKRVELSRAGLMIATHDPANGEDERSDKLVDVVISKMRPKLLALGVSISSGGGAFKFDLGNKAKLRALVKAAQPEAAE
jgi:hypothetical protein